MKNSFGVWPRMLRRDLSHIAEFCQDEIKIQGRMTRKYLDLIFSDVQDKHRRFGRMDTLNFRGSTR